MTTIYNNNNGVATQLTIPAVNDTLVGITTVNTLQNKTLVSGASGNTVITDRLYSASGVVTVSTGAPSASQTLYTSNSTTSAWSSVDNLGSTIYGTGLDADPDIGAGVTVTLARDSYYDNLTIATGGVLITAGFRLFVKGTTTLNGTARIHCNGNNASGQTAGAAGTTNTIGAGAAGTNGGAINTAGGTGGAVTAATMMGGTGGAGGAATGTGARTGGAGGSSSAPAAINGGSQVFNDYSNAVRCVDVIGTKLNGGCGGGGGGGNSANVGGGGGGGGGVVMFASKTIDGTGFISANGGNGGNGAGTAGGGGGGGGGSVVVMYTNLNISSANITASGGSGGTGGNAGTAGSAGNVYLIQRT